MGIPERFPTQRLFEDTRDAYVFGSAVSFGYYFSKGIYDSPKGFPKVAHMDAGLLAAKMNFPKTAGIMTLATGTFSTVEYSMEYLRQKDDPFNQIAAGVTIAGLLTIHNGLRFATRFALIGGPPAGLLIAGAKMLAE